MCGISFKESKQRDINKKEETSGMRLRDVFICHPENPALYVHLPPNPFPDAVSPLITLAAPSPGASQEDQKV